MENKSNTLVIMKSTLGRLPVYYCYLQEKMRQGERFVSSTTIAQSLSLNPVLVRKDLAGVASSPGRPKLGFEILPLMEDMKRFLGYDNVTEAVLVGVGGLGRTLLHYQGFDNYGLSSTAALPTTALALWRGSTVTWHFTACVSAGNRCSRLRIWMPSSSGSASISASLPCLRQRHRRCAMRLWQQGSRPFGILPPPISMSRRVFWSKMRIWQLHWRHCLMSFPAAFKNKLIFFYRFSFCFQFN